MNNSLFNHIEKIKKKILNSEYEEADTIIVFAEGDYKNWNIQKEIFENELDTKILKILSTENLDKYYNKAKNLQELKDLGKKYNFKVLVLPTETGAITMEEIWGDY